MKHPRFTSSCGGRTDDVWIDGALPCRPQSGNLIVLPLVLGIGVDDGVHVLHDFRANPGRYQVSASTANAVVLTSLTSMIGFGSMMVAAHRGLYSVGQVLVIGIGSCMFVSLVTLPSLLTILDQFRVPREEDQAYLEEEDGTIPFSSDVA
ncbi:MAG: MMPL family transporter [Planctomycetaceae bacterium]